MGASLPSYQAREGALSSSLTSCLALCSGPSDTSVAARAFAERAKELLGATGVAEADRGAEEGPDAPASTTTSGSDSADLLVDVELAFRAKLRDILLVGGERGDSDGKMLLSLAIDYSATDGAPVGASRIPAVVLEDLVEMQTTENCKQLWGWLEESSTAEKLGSLIVGAPRAKTALLRLCNTLLRRLSKMHDTEFSGRVLLFLASVFPLGERSAVNLGGKRNTDNVTVFEDEEDFESTRGGGASRPDELGSADDSMEVEATAARGVDGSEGEDKFPIDYALYRAFWALQGRFLDPEKQLESEQEWSGFWTDVDKVLTSFEGNTFSEHDLLLAGSRVTADDGGMDVDGRKIGLGANPAEGEGFFVCKYLTSSRLLRLQLRDPTLRLQIISQLMIMQHVLRTTLRAKGLAEDEAEASLAKRRLKDLSTVASRARALMKNTPPHGSLYQKMLERVLNREGNWVQWKANKCPDLEARSTPVPSAEAEDGNGKEARKSRKRKHASSPSTGGQHTIRAHAFDVFDSSDLASVSRELRARAPVMNSHMEFMVECMDPTSGVDDEYHPKHDKLYCWRATRLIAMERPDLLDHMQDGDVTKAATVLMGGVPEEAKPEPEPEPQPDLANPPSSEQGEDQEGPSDSNADGAPDGSEAQANADVEPGFSEARATSEPEPEAENSSTVNAGDAGDDSMPPLAPLGEAEQH